MNYSLLALLTLITTFNLYADQCFRLNSPEQLAISFESYTTPRKNPVVIGFSQFELQGQAQAESLQKLLENLSVTINTSEGSLITDNPARQTIVANIFFQKMNGGGDIRANFQSVDQEFAYLRVQMNQHTQVVPMRYRYSDGKLEAYGHLDVFDFKLERPFQALDQICQELHDGKTWNVVKIMLEANIHSC